MSVKTPVKPSPKTPAKPLPKTSSKTLTKTSAKTSAKGPDKPTKVRAPLAAKSSSRSGVEKVQSAGFGVTPQPASVANEPAVGVRTIKKYPNRRLYDTTTSAYVTLSEIKKLVLQASPMVVVDAKTGADLTRSILLQIILDEESAGMPMLSEAVLHNIIRFYGHTMQGHMGSYLESHVQSFMDWQSKLGESSPTLSPEVWAQFMQWQTPLMHNMFSGLADPSQNVLAQLQDQIQKQLQKQIQKNAEQFLGVLGLKS